MASSEFSAVYDEIMAVIRPGIERLNGLAPLLVVVPERLNADAIREIVLAMIRIMGRKAYMIKNDEQRQRFTCAMLGHILYCLDVKIRELFIGRDDFSAVMDPYKCVWWQVLQARYPGKEFETKQDVMNMSSEWKS